MPPPAGRRKGRPYEWRSKMGTPKKASLLLSNPNKVFWPDEGYTKLDLARFYVASAYIADGDLPDARDSLVAFLAEERDPLFRSLALTNLAVVYERMADWKKAAGAYQQAAADPGPEQARAELGVARMLAKSGDKQGAIAAYRGFLNAHPFAQQRQDVMESLALLGAPADVLPIPSVPGASPQQVLIH